MNDTQFQIDHLIELAVLQRAELKTLVDSMPELRDHLSEEIERNLEEAEPAIRSELEQLVIARAKDAHAESSATLNAKIEELAKALEITTAAKYSVLMAERAENESLLAQAETRIAEAASALPGAVAGMVTEQLSRFPRAGEIDQLRKEFAEPRGLNPRGRWAPDESYQRLDLVTINGDSFVSNIDGNRERPSRTAGDWTLSAARGNGGGGGGVTTMTDLVPVPSNGQLLIGNGSAFVNATLTAGTGISISNGAGSITINATDGNITLDDGTAAAPSLNFTSDTNTGLYRPAADTVGIVGGGHDIVRLTDVASATDYLEIKNAIGVSTPLHVQASGSSTNIGMHLQPKGSGLITISDGTDFNKGIRFRSSSSAASAITLLDAVSTAGRVITLPDATDTLVGKATTDTLTNKTLTSPTLTAPVLGTPASGTLTNATGLPLTTGITGTLAVANGGTGVTTSTGSGANVLSTSPTLVTPLLGTPTSGVLTNATGLPILTGVSGLGANVAAFLATPSSANLAAALTDETGTGANVFATSPTLTTPISASLTAPAAIDLTLAGGSSGASLVLGQGGTASTLTGSGVNQWLLINNTAASSGYVVRTARQGTTLGVYHTTAAAALGTVSNHPLDFFTFDGATALRLTTTNNILIGTTTDMTGSGGLKVAGTTASTGVGTGALQIAGGAYIGGASVFGSTVKAAALVASGNLHALGFVPNATGLSAGANYSGGDSETNLIFGAATSAQAMRFQRWDGAALTNILTLAGTGAATFAGAVTVGTGAAVGGATAGAGGLAFPATAVAVADANTLDDYEEGTWTPTLTPATSGTITVSSPNLCAYTKIGRVVTVNGLVDTASVSTPVGASVTVNNLPFTSNATPTQRSAAGARCFNLTSGSLNTTISIVSSVTTFTVHVDASLFQTGSQVYFQLTYTVD